MICPRCRHDDPPGAKFCVERAAPLQRACGRCLGPIYRWFTEGLDSKDLREARALLDALA